MREERDECHVYAPLTAVCKYYEREAIGQDPVAHDFVLGVLARAF